MISFCFPSRARSHSKSPLSETTTVPVCLRRSSEVVMVSGKVRMCASSLGPTYLYGPGCSCCFRRLCHGHGALVSLSSLAVSLNESTCRRARRTLVGRLRCPQGRQNDSWRAQHQPIPIRGTASITRRQMRRRQASLPAASPTTLKDERELQVYRGLCSHCIRAMGQ